MSIETGGERLPHPRKIDTALVGIAVTILLQCIMAIWWAATMNSRVEKLEADVAPVRSMAETMARLDERTRAMEGTTQRIERKLDSAEERR